MTEDIWLVIFGGVMALLGQALMAWLLISDTKFAIAVRNVFRKSES